MTIKLILMEFRFIIIKANQAWLSDQLRVREGFVGAAIGAYV